MKAPWIRPRAYARHPKYRRGPGLWRRGPKKPLSGYKLLGLRLFLAAAMVCAALAVFEYKIRPVMLTICTHQADMLCTQAINTAVSQVLEESGASYQTLVYVSKDAQNNITAVETDAGSTSALKAQVANRVLKILQENGTGDLSIPLGTLLDSQLFIGKGPRVGFKVVPSSSAAINIEGKLTACGINQTLHQIILTVDVNYTAIVPGVTTHSDISTQFLLAETVIVGEVPEAYTQVSGDDGSVERKIFDYGALGSRG